MVNSGWSNSTGWLFSTCTAVSVPDAGATIGFITFIASMIRIVSPAFTAEPTAAKFGGSGGGGCRGDRRSGGGGRDGGGSISDGRGHRGRLARDANLAVAVLDFDLGQAGVVEKLGKRADIGRIDIDAIVFMVTHENIPVVAAFLDKDARTAAMPT